MPDHDNRNRSPARPVTPPPFLPRDGSGSAPSSKNVRTGTSAPQHNKPGVDDAPPRPAAGQNTTTVETAQTVARYKRWRPLVERVISQIGPMESGNYATGASDATDNNSPSGSPRSTFPVSSTSVSATLSPAGLSNPPNRPKPVPEGPPRSLDAKKQATQKPNTPAQNANTPHTNPVTQQPASRLPGERSLRWQQIMVEF